jgi:hypothetical protein
MAPNCKHYKIGQLTTQASSLFNHQTVEKEAAKVKSMSTETADTVHLENCADAKIR